MDSNRSCFKLKEEINMDLIITLIGFSFSFFFILLSYWKEDRNLNIIGSISAFTMCVIMIGTSIQTTTLVPTTSTLTTEIIDENVTVTTEEIGYEMQIFNQGLFLESSGIALMMAIFVILQYLYFTLIHNLKKGLESEEA